MIGLAERTAAPRPGLAERLTRAFFRSFFRLLLAFVALAEWACAAWVLRTAGIELPALVHLLAPVALFFLNRLLIVRGRALRPPFDRLMRVYVAIAFTSVFGALFLALAGAAWAVVAAVTTLAAPDLAPAVGQGYAAIVSAGLGVIGLLFLYGYTVGRRGLAITRLVVPVRGLPRALDGLRIAHLSDLHIGAYLDAGQLAAHVERVNALEPDLICLTGDLVDRPETCALAFPTLAGLRARHGVLVTLGNHDFYAGAEVVTDALRRLTPFTVLRNGRATIDVAGAVLPVIGVDDLGRDWARGVLDHPALPPLAAAIAPGTPFIVLSHRPDCFPQAARHGATLVLSGHTHGGQLGLPAGRGRVRNLAQFITAFDRGLYRDGDAILYVNRGLGFTGQPIRLFTPREIAVLELRTV